MTAIIAVAGNTEARRETTGLGFGQTEAENFWMDFLRSLKARGLDGVKLGDQRRTCRPERRNLVRLRGNLAALSLLLDARYSLPWLAQSAQRRRCRYPAGVRTARLIMTSHHLENYTTCTDATVEPDPPVDTSLVNIRRWKQHPNHEMLRNFTNVISPPRCPPGIDHNASFERICRINL